MNERSGDEEEIGNSVAETDGCIIDSTSDDEVSTSDDEVSTSGNEVSTSGDEVSTSGDEDSMDDTGMDSDVDVDTSDEEVMSFPDGEEATLMS